MGKSNEPGSISEALSKLEGVGQSKAQDIKTMLEKDYLDIKKKLEELKPQFEDIKAKVESEAKEAKHQVEEKVRENPWFALGIVGLIAFVIGWILGNSRKH